MNVKYVIVGNGASVALRRFTQEEGPVHKIEMGKKLPVAFQRLLYGMANWRALYVYWDTDTKLLEGLWHTLRSVNKEQKVEDMLRRILKAGVDCKYSL